MDFIGKKYLGEMFVEVWERLLLVSKKSEVLLEEVVSLDFGFFFDVELKEEKVLLILRGLLGMYCSGSVKWILSLYLKLECLFGIEEGDLGDELVVLLLRNGDEYFFIGFGMFLFLGGSM